MWIVFVPAEPTNAVFLTNVIKIVSGIGPRNAISIQIFWAAELAVKF